MVAASALIKVKAVVPPLTETGSCRCRMRIDLEGGNPVSRAQRLLDLIQLLRRHRFPISGAALAEELGVSLRTLYRDIETLIAQGARIDGEAGVGYVLRPGFMLPPLMFSEEEIDALVLGSRWVAERGGGGRSPPAMPSLPPSGRPSAPSTS